MHIMHIIYYIKKVGIFLSVQHLINLINFVHLIPFRKTLCNSRRAPKRLVNIFRTNDMDRVPKLKKMFSLYNEVEMISHYVCSNTQMFEEALLRTVFKYIPIQLF